LHSNAATFTKKPSEAKRLDEVCSKCRVMQIYNTSILTVIDRLFVCLFQTGPRIEIG